MTTKARGKLTAKTADRHALYQASVQGPDFEVQLMGRIFEQHAGRPARTFREDFCGTALLSLEWVKSHPERIATGLDIDRPTLDWGRIHNLTPAGELGARVKLLEQNVLERTATRHDVVCAFNYSYSVFHTRAALRSYFEAAYASLVDDGILVLDAFGGWEAQQVLTERRKVKGFTYIWDQAAYDPISHRFLAHIHFEFPDGTARRRAFTYDWRLWTLAELRELMVEAGFVEVDVYWEGEDPKTNLGNGIFKRVEKASNDPGWNAYLVAKRSPASAGSKDAERASKAAARRPAKK